MEQCERASLRRLSERQADQRVEAGAVAQIVLGRGDGGAGFGGLEAEVEERGDRIGAGTGGRRDARRTAKREAAGLVLQIVDDALGELGADAVGARYQRLVELGDRGVETGGGEGGGGGGRAGGRERVWMDEES